MKAKELKLREFQGSLRISIQSIIGVIDTLADYKDIEVVPYDVAARLKGISSSINELANKLKNETTV